MSVALALGMLGAAGIGALANGIGAANDRNANLSVANKNYQLQKEQLDYQKALQQQIFEREDTAVQRRKNDLLAAGMNPYLSATQPGAGAGSVVSTNAPQFNYKENMGQIIGQNLSNTIGQALDTYVALNKAKQSAIETEFMKYNLWANFGVNHPTSTSWFKDGNFGIDIHDNWSMPKDIGDVRNSYVGKMNDVNYIMEQARKEGLNISNDILRVDKEFRVMNNISSLLLDGVKAYTSIRNPYILQPKFNKIRR